MTDPDGGPRRRRVGRLADRSPEHIAALLKERIYGTIACLSTLLLLARHVTQTDSAWSALLDVVIAMGGFWAAGTLSELVAYLGVHRGAPRGAELRHALSASGQILEAAGAPALLLMLAGVGVLPLSAALWAAVWVLIATMGLFALLAVRRTTLPWWGRLLLVCALLVLGMLVVLLKLLAH